MWSTLLTGALAFTGAALGHFFYRRTSKELDIWRRREETMRILRWSAEQAASTNRSAQLIGLAVLNALGDSELLQAEDQALIDAVAGATIKFASEYGSKYNWKPEGGDQHGGHTE